jgi:hypothetical protein
MQSHAILQLSLKFMTTPHTNHTLIQGEYLNLMLYINEI